MGLAFVLLYIALNLLSPTEMIPALAPYRPMLVLAVVNIPFAVMSRMRAPEVGKLRVQPVLVLLFFAFTCIALIPHRLFGANVITFEELLPNVLAYFLGMVHFRTPQRLQVVRALLVALAIFILVNGIIELPYAHASGAETPYVMVAGHVLSTMEFRIRGRGMLADPNTFGQFVLLILPLLFVSSNDEGLGIGWAGAVPVSAFFLFAIYLTGSRGAVLGLLVVISLFLIRKLHKTGAVLVTIFGGLALLALNAYNTRSISLQGGKDRLAIWSDGLSYFKESPLWGIGPRNFIERFGMTAHNSFLLVAAELGFIGLFLWLSMSVVTFIQLNAITRLRTAKPEVIRWAMALRVSLGGYLFTSFFLSRAYELPLYMLLGMCGGIIIAAGGDDAAPPRAALWPVFTVVSSAGAIFLIWVMLRLRFA